MTVSVTLVTILVIMARMLYMQFFSARRHLNPEEWCIIVAATIGLPSACINVFALVPSGMSKDVWGLHPAGLVATARYFFIVSITYVVLMMLVKLSLTFFYLSIFTGRIRYLLWATIAFHVVTATTYLLGVVFQCIPTAYTWEKSNFASTNPVQGHCLDLNTAGWANSAVSVAADLWLLSLPLSQVHKLRLTWKKKVGAALMFMTGTM
ncbi:hypothetical protein CCM_03998 [Cordyceps militaris CM01]|uniref:Rhodopsin domain-containing protein n=1 Tax=Cordyceps militaris (strain CM01) TaxID=983644 RepID=G3JDF0_CORMM|nr:uncharacterized protein CCM_03998 [Cordyceps militaris CM01]EGX92625.1 hypothetical protein CCM_03998 [Cordyceps militaris CM01]